MTTAPLNSRRQILGHCCIVGAGPAGAVLALLLAREGVRVTLLEASRSFRREFRGNSLGSSSMEIMQELGLSEGLHELGSAKARQFVAQAGTRRLVFADFSRLGSPYPYVLMLPQARFLDHVVGEARRRYPNFRLVMGARVRELIEEGGVVRGVRYEGEDGPREVRAQLTVGTDGRFSVMRKLAGLEPEHGSNPMDVLWFNVPRLPSDPGGSAGALFRVGPGLILAMMDHFDHWQIGYIIRKDSHKEIKARGISALRGSVAALAPELADRMERVTWGDVSLLPVASDRLRRWHKPGLLLLGDAAHVVSPLGGVGINLAIQDAAAAAEVLTGPLRVREVKDLHLATVQRRREGTVRMVQAVQDLAQRWIVSGILDARGRYELPRTLLLMSRVPILRDIPSRLIAFGALTPRRKRKRK